MRKNIYYVGMDVHKVTTVIVVLNEEGKQVMQQIVETKSSTLVSAITAIRGTIHLTFEEGTQANWLYELLKPYVANLVVCNASKIEKTGNKNKSDIIDAYKLANLLRQGLIPGVYKEPTIQRLKELTHSYQYLVNDCTRIKNRIKTIFRSRAIECEGETVYNPTHREKWVAKLSEAGSQSRLRLLYKELDQISELKEQAAKLMTTEARKNPAFELLDSIPQLGPVRVSQILAVMVTHQRFRTKRQLWSYSGFAVKTESSADYEMRNGAIKRVINKTQTRGLNQSHNHMLKNVFKSTANSVQKGPLKDYYERLVNQGMKPEMARLSLARKIAAIVLAVWQKGEKFNPDFLAEKEKD